MANSPTIVMASLSDDQLKKSIESLVTHVDEAMKKMVQSANNAVGEMEAKLKSLGNLKIDSGGSADGGASKRTKTQNAETEAVEKNVAARDKQIKKNQEAATSFDQMAKAQQVAIRSASPSEIRNADTLQTMNIQLDLLRERLREARQQYSSFVALAAHATTTGDKGLFQYATDGVHRYEQEVRNLIPQIRTLQSGIQQMGDVIAPQGHTIQNYVNSLQKANPELAQLNEQFKRGKSLLQQQKTEFEQNAQAQRNSTNQQKQSLDEMNAYIRQNIQREQERRDAIRQTGLAARETANQLIRSAHEQTLAQEKNPITGTKELTEAVKKMRLAYFDMSASEKASPIGLALEADIKRANDAITVIRKYNQSLLGAQQNDANKITNASTLNSLRESLKNLTEQYSKLTIAEIRAGKGDELIQKYQKISRAAHVLQKQLSTPISFSAIDKFNARSLDDIAYKMQMLRSYRQSIDLTKPNAANEIKQVDEALTKLQKDADKWMSKSQEMIKSNTALGRSWNYMKNRLAFYFTVGASTQFIKNLIEVRSQYEMNERALGILIDSAERGTQIFNELSQMALVSPYTLIELSTAAKQLTAYDVAAKDVVDTTRRLADMASAVGIPIERLTYALGQIKAYGYLNNRDARMFANAGIPLVKQLSDYYTQLEGRLVSTADVYDRIKKKTIDYEQVVQVINKMTDEGGKFFDFQAKMADTLKVRLANLTLAWNNMLNDMGSSNQGVLTTGIGLLRDMFLHWKDLESAIGKVAAAFGIYKAAQLVTLIWTGRITTAMGVQELVGKKLQARFASLTIAQKGFVSAATAGWAALAFIVADAWLTISRNMEEIEQLNKSIADGAKESYEAIDKMLHSSEMVSTRLSAAQGKLSDTDAAKAWEMLREQIELSAASSKELIAQLIKEPDLNKRVTESFNLAEKIEEANRKLSDLNDSLDVSQNSILGGLFGEGLAEDIDDYNARIKYTSDVAEWASKKNKGFWENAAMGLRGLFNEVKDSFGSDANEAQDEIKNFAQKAAQTIKDELGEEALKDKVQVNEAIARVIKGMEQQFPQIRGKGKTLFETIFYDVMAKEFSGAVDSQAYYYEKFLGQLKKDHASAFADVTEDINKDTHKWSAAQLDAIQKTADKVKKDLPAASQNAIDEILRQLNSTDFKVRIVAEMATTSLDNVQKQFREKFIEKPWIADDKEREKEEASANQRYGTLMRKNTESNAEYEKRISDERKKQLELSQKNAEIIANNKEKQDDFSKAVTADAQKQKEAADDWLKAAKEIEDAGGYDFSTKKENAADRKAAKQAESELAKALKDELSTIDKVRSIYKDLTKEGMSHANAVERATRGWDETVNAINRVLQKNGLQKLDLSKFAGIENPRELVNMLQSQLNTLLKRGAKAAEIKELQTKVNTLEVDADKYDLTKITKGLNNELGRLKDEYELAVELDADPELGGIFADMIGINKETLSQLPKDFNGVVEKLQQIVDDKLGNGKFSVLGNLNKSALDSWLQQNQVKIDSDKGKALVAITEYANKIRKDETEKQVKEWDKLLEKYAEYEYKRKEIFDEYEREMAIARKQNASDEIISAIENKRNERLADLEFDKFAKTPEWIVATGELANMSKSALDLLINKIQEYRRTAKNLSPKQIKQLNKALKDLYKEQRANNPFNYIKNMMERAKEKAEVFDESISETTDKISELEVSIFKAKEAGKDTTAAEDKLKALRTRLQELKEARNAAMEIDATAWAGAFNEWVGAVKSVTSSFDDLLNAVGANKLTSRFNEVFGVLEKAGSMASTGAQIGGKWGAIVGGIVGAASGIITAMSDTLSGNAAINSEISDSVEQVKRLENTYKLLNDAIKDAYGTAEIGAKRAIMVNKELQLEELKRQLVLEESRKSKNRDDEKIENLKGQIIDLELELKNTTREIVNDLMGISSVGDAAEQMVSSMITAFKNGEKYMESYKQAFDSMIENLIMKSIVGQVIGSKLETIFAQVEEFSKKRADETLFKASDVTGGEFADLVGSTERTFEGWASTLEKWISNPNISEQDKDKYNKWLENLRKLYTEAVTPTIEDVKGIEVKKDEWEGEVKEVFDAYMDAFGINFGQDAQAKLSALKQGIQGITEDTAGALEAYMNGVSQQVYLQSDLLTQIRDTVVGLDMDVQVATQAQMLLQLQQSYAVQMTIQGILEGVLNPSGRAFSVELVS